MAGRKQQRKSVGGSALSRIMPRHAPFYFALIVGLLAFVTTLLLAPGFAISIGANAMYVGYLGLTAVKQPYLTAAYLQAHARDEDTPAFGIFLIVLITVVASVASLFLALSSGDHPDIWQVVISLLSVLLGWFTVQTLGAAHYAYEFYQAPETTPKKGDPDVRGGLDFSGDEPPDGSAFMYFSYTVGTSVATSDTKVTSNAMRRRVLVHQVFAHFYNTIILAAAVNVMLTLGGAG